MHDILKLDRTWRATLGYSGFKQEFAQLLGRKKVSHYRALPKYRVKSLMRSDLLLFHHFITAVAQLVQVMR